MTDVPRPHPGTGNQRRRDRGGPLPISCSGRGLTRRRGQRSVIGLECSGQHAPRGPVAASETRFARCWPAAGTPSRCHSCRTGHGMPTPVTSRRSGSRRSPGPCGQTSSWSRTCGRVPPCLRRDRHVHHPASRTRSSPPLAPEENFEVCGRLARTSRSTIAKRTRRGSSGYRQAGGADVILDNMGAKYLSRNVRRSRWRAGWSCIRMSSTKVDDIATLLEARRGRGRRHSSRPVEEKAGRDVHSRGRARLAVGRSGDIVKPVIHRRFPLTTTPRPRHAAGH